MQHYACFVWRDEKSGSIDDEKRLALGPDAARNLTALALTINSKNQFPDPHSFEPDNRSCNFVGDINAAIPQEQHMPMESPSGLLTGHNLVSCIGELSAQDYDDLTQCTQIATQSADMVSSRFVDSTNWLDEYVSTLNFFGWSVFQDAIFTRTRYDLSKSVAQFLVQSAQGMRDPRQGNAMIDTLDALKSDKPALYSLDEESLMGERFQVIPARYDPKGFLEIAIFNLELVAYTRKSGFLFWNWESQTAKIIQQRTYLKLDKNKLERNRALIEKKGREIGMKRFDLRRT